MLKKSLGLMSLILMPIALYLIFFYASIEATMGIVQKIFYFHVPNALMSYASAGLLGLASIMYLIKGDRTWDRFGSVAGELGAVFTSTAIVSGMIWAKPAWGEYWASGDPRLNLELILFLTFIAYLMLRAYLPNREKRATLSCVFGLLALLNIPFNWLSIYFFRTQHPQPVVSPGGGGLEPDMEVAFYVSFIAWVALYGYLFISRLEVAKLQEQVDYLEHKVHMA